MLYLLYTSPLEDIVKLYNLDFHFYANDTPLYLAFKPNAAEQPGSIARIEASVCGIGLMDGAEEVEVEQAQNRTADLSAHHRPRPSIEHIDLYIYIYPLTGFNRLLQQRILMLFVPGPACY